ncbi:MAG: hypothetical protein D6729_15795 [Deltaproteobacteria bacterium]|nr:MAG: hypothetical protein D6729_15795 [Deltaproteobacteria bacterium]
MRAPPPVPGFARHLLLLWRMRVDSALGARRGPGRLFAVAGYLASALPALPLAAGGYALLTWSPIARSHLWPRLFYDLLAFVTFCVWVAWPVMSARVDDHSELRRFLAFPITPWRLLVASSLATLVEPLGLVLTAPLLGATFGYLSLLDLSPWAALPHLAAFLVLCVAWSRAALHLVIGVLRRRRGAQAIGGFFAVVVAVSLLIPPVDTSWLEGAGGTLGGVSPEFALQAALGLSRVPTGYLGEGLRTLAAGSLRGALLEWGLLAAFAGVGLYYAWRLLLEFRDVSGRRGAGSVRVRRGLRPFARTRSVLATLVVREALDLWRNPRARLLAFVPLLLAVLIRVFSGRDLILHLVPARADAWLMGGLVLYAAIVFGTTFAQNIFGYDDRGFALYLSAPVDLGTVARAKNLVHGATALLMALGFTVFYRLYFGAGGLFDAAAALLAVATVVPILTASGNVTSALWPVRYHTTLDRRDRQPRAAMLFGLSSAGLGVAPWAAVLGRLGEGPLGASHLAVLAAVALVAWIVAGLTHRRAVRLLVRRREAILQAISRDG